ncbi:polysaccharide biosynthesis tyrosine autokinase [Faecalimonas sp.]
MVEITLNLKKDDYRNEEAFKSLRTNIEFSGEDNKVIALTSCTPSEGKSSVSLGLAKAFAEDGKSVLFVDADLRKSVLLGRYRIMQDVKGLTHFLSGQAEISEVICKTEVSGLYMIFAGPVPPNPAELLGSKKFASFISGVRKLYDYVIIDTPPLGSVIDSAIVSSVCDAAILVIAANSVSYKFARVVKEQLEKSNCKLLGTVLNKVDMKQDKYYGKYYGHHGEK